MIEIEMRTFRWILLLLTPTSFLAADGPELVIVDQGHGRLSYYSAGNVTGTDKATHPDEGEAKVGAIGPVGPAKPSEPPPGIDPRFIPDRGPAPLIFPTHDLADLYAGAQVDFFTEPAVQLGVSGTEFHTHRVQFAEGADGEPSRSSPFGVVGWVHLKAQQHEAFQVGCQVQVTLELHEGLDHSAYTIGATYVDKNGNLNPLGPNSDPGKWKLTLGIDDVDGVLTKSTLLDHLDFHQKTGQIEDIRFEQDDWVACDSLVSAHTDLPPLLSPRPSALLAEVWIELPGTVYLSPFALDFNGNGIVDFGDFLVISANFGKSPATHSDGDVDGDGDVDFADFLTFSRGF